MQQSRAVFERHVVFALQANFRTQQEKPEPEIGFQHLKGENPFYFLFSDRIVVGLKNIYL